MPTDLSANGGASDEAEMDSFLSLSIELTGFERAELFATGLCDQYLVESRTRIGPATWHHLMAVGVELAGMTGRWRTAHAREQLYRTPEMAAVTRRIILLWYTGTWFDTLPFGGAPLSANAYVEGLVWRAIGAHPMAAKPQGYGAWALPPPADPFDGENSYAG